MSSKPKDVAAFLVRAIQNKWKPPDAWVRHQEKEQQKIVDQKKAEERQRQIDQEKQQRSETSSNDLQRQKALLDHLTQLPSETQQALHALARSEAEERHKFPLLFDGILAKTMEIYQSALVRHPALDSADVSAAALAELKAAGVNAPNRDDNHEEETSETRQKENLRDPVEWWASYLYKEICKNELSIENITIPFIAEMVPALSTEQIEFTCERLFAMWVTRKEAA